MGRGLSRAFTGPAAAVGMMMASLSRAKHKTGESIFSAFDLDKIRKSAEKWAAKMAGGGRIPGRSYKPNGPKECARRVAQMNRWPSNIPMEQRRMGHDG